MLFSKIIKKKFDAVLGRYDGNPALYYFSSKDFPDIKSEAFDVKGSKGLLRGYFYYYNEINPQKFIIFDHGIGAGHLAYFKEIELLAKNGYTVYSYDHTGCVSSEGEGIYGFAQGVNDLNHVVDAIEKDERFEDTQIKIIGHSWGGYSAMNVVHFHPEITHVVSIAGFVSAKSLVEQYLPNFVMKYSPEVMARERKINPEYTDLDACETIKNSSVKFMYIQSTDDKMVKYDLAFKPLTEALKGRDNTTFISEVNRNHTPHWTDSACRKNGEMEEAMASLTKKKRLTTREEQESFKNSQDWNGITEQDPVVWSKIFEFLES